MGGAEGEINQSIKTNLSLSPPTQARGAGSGKELPRKAEPPAPSAHTLVSFSLFPRGHPCKCPCTWAGRLAGALGKACECEGQATALPCPWEPHLPPALQNRRSHAPPSPTTSPSASPYFLSVPHLLTLETWTVRLLCAGICAGLTGYRNKTSLAPGVRWKRKTGGPRIMTPHRPCSAVRLQE